MATKTKTPLGAWPGGKDPHDLENLEKNLAAARSRHAGCIAARDAIWRQILEHSERGMIQQMVFLREKAEQQNVWGLALERKIMEWEEAKSRIESGGMLR